jgi:hypothetical protein
LETIPEARLEKNCDIYCYRSFLSFLLKFLAELAMSKVMWTSYSTGYGLPLPFYVTIMSAPLPISESTHFYSINLIVDIIVWYLLSCFIVWLYDKRKKK